MFISTDELQNLLNSNSVQIIHSGRDHKQEYISCHIPKAIPFNFAEIIDNTSRLSYGFPSLEIFRRHMIALGIKNDGGLKVVYDANMILSGRAWYMLKHFGVSNVRILNGALTKWAAEGKPVESGEFIAGNPESNYNENDFNFTENENCNFIALYSEVKRISEEIKSGQNNAKLWDNRPKENFDEGTVDGSINIPWTEFVNPDLTVKTPEEVKEIVTRILGDGPIVVTCTRGVAACFGLALLDYCGLPNRKVYAGSYEEWSQIHAN